MLKGLFVLGDFSFQIFAFYRFFYKKAIKNLIKGDFVIQKGDFWDDCFWH